MAVGNPVSELSTVYRFSHSNAFGSLRLLLASFVIISHVPELYYGSRDFEAINAIFGTVSLGDIAVDGFFIISGYLITASVVGSPTNWAYLKKRLARIYPGFLCAYLICVGIVAPLGGATMPGNPGEFFSVLMRALLLQPPNLGTVFAGSPFPFLNTPMWTISIEFKCYLLTLLLWWLGVLGRRRWLLGVTIIVLLANLFIQLDHYPFDMTPTERPIPNVFNGAEWQTLVLGNKRGWVRLTGMYLSGTCFYLFRDLVRFRLSFVIGAAVCLSMCLFFDPLANLATGIFGAYLVFAIAMGNTENLLAKINNRNDISYGVYLYGWPVTKLLIDNVHNLSSTGVAVLALAFSYLAGWLSWHLIEKPWMRRAR